jgi:hypothetical protein
MRLEAVPLVNRGMSLIGLIFLGTLEVWGVASLEGFLMNLL